MNIKDLNEYVLAMEKIEAHEVLVLIQATAYPHQTKQDQTRAHNRLRKACEVEEKELDSFELAQALGFVNV